MVASLVCFIKKRVMNKIFFIPKQSRLVTKYPVRFSNGENKMAAKLVAILFLPFEIRTNSRDFKWSCLDCFINKSHKKYFIHAKTV
jgi:hypothetical protein